MKKTLTWNVYLRAHKEMAMKHIRQHGELFMLEDLFSAPYMLAPQVKQIVPLSFHEWLALPRAHFSVTTNPQVIRQMSL